jgi:hypothetical protein
MSTLSGTLAVQPRRMTTRRQRGIKHQDQSESSGAEQPLPSRSTSERSYAALKSENLFHTQKLTYSKVQKLAGGGFRQLSGRCRSAYPASRARQPFREPSKYPSPRFQRVCSVISPPFRPFRGYYPQSSVLTQKLHSPISSNYTVS